MSSFRVQVELGLCFLRPRFALKFKNVFFFNKFGLYYLFEAIKTGGNFMIDD